MGFNSLWGATFLFCFWSYIFCLSGHLMHTVSHVLLKDVEFLQSFAFDNVFLTFPYTSKYITLLYYAGHHRIPMAMFNNVVRPCVPGHRVPEKRTCFSSAFCYKWMLWEMYRNIRAINWFTMFIDVMYF